MAMAWTGSRRLAMGFYTEPTPSRRRNPAIASSSLGATRTLEQEPSTSALFYVGLPELRAYEKRQRAPGGDTGQSLTAPIVELSKLLPEPLSIRSVVPSPRLDAVYLTCRKRDDLVYHRQTSGFCIKLNPQEALATYLRREGEAASTRKPSGRSRVANSDSRGQDNALDSGVRPGSPAVGNEKKGGSKLPGADNASGPSRLERA